MKTASKLVAAATFALVLTSCAGGQRGPRFKPGVINRVLATAPGEAQPSAVVAIEVAYAQAAKEKGQYTAALEFAAGGAKLHGRNGPVPFAALAESLPDPAKPVEWSPRKVIMSCDGALAISAGRFRDQEGFVGDYVTAWVRQADNTYKWSYDVAGRDNPQPPPRADVEEGDILVTAIDAIQGLVASCPTPEIPVSPPPLSLTDSDPGATQLSKDRTLQWRWEHRPDGTKFVSVDYFYEGEWVRALEEGLASPPEE